MWPKQPSEENLWLKCINQKMREIEIKWTKPNTQDPRKMTKESNLQKVERNNKVKTDIKKINKNNKAIRIDQ